MEVKRKLRAENGSKRNMPVRFVCFTEVSCSLVVLLSEGGQQTSCWITPLADGSAVHEPFAQLKVEGFINIRGDIPCHFITDGRVAVEAVFF